MTLLNEKLAKKQKITDKQRENLDKLYEELDVLFGYAKVLNDTDQLTSANAHKLADKVRNIEFELQENWNFSQNPLCHTWWNKIDGCRCPKLDNIDRFGTDKIINTKCPYHGEVGLESH